MPGSEPITVERERMLKLWAFICRDHHARYGTTPDPDDYCGSNGPLKKYLSERKARQIVEKN